MTFEQYVAEHVELMGPVELVRALVRTLRRRP